MHPYGSWPSPVSADLVAAGARRLSAVTVDGDDVYWLEGRPEESGRNVLVRRTGDGRVEDVTLPPVNVRTRVHEYGGGAFAVSRGVVYFSEFTDQRLYRVRAGEAPEPVTPPGPWSYADADIAASGRFLVCVREEHGTDGAEAANTLVRVRLDGPAGTPEVIASGHDFFSTPRISPDGTRLCWVSWDHPRMPWDGTDLWTAALGPDGRLDAPVHVAGGPEDAIFQPGWSPDGELCFASDRTGWWCVYRWRGGRVEPLAAIDGADIGRPQWQFGMSTWAFASRSRLAVSFQERGRWRLGAVDADTGVLTPVPTELEPGESITTDDACALLVGTSPAAPDRVARIELTTGATRMLRSAADVAIDDAYLSRPAAIEFPTTDGSPAHAFFYAPRNRDCPAPPDERPPLVVVSHGGPTASTSTRLNLEIQYFTSRGFAVVDVNYGGSSGYGRAYRERLRGRWGVVDVDDCVGAATYLAASGRADGDRLLIRGRSAGGYTTLAALAFRPDVFRAGASYYGVSDLEALAADTHKFESRYLDTLVGPYPADRATYRARSPLRAAGRIRCPVVFFQGLEDLVVPPSQCHQMAAAMRANGLEAEVHVFEGEQHGFRKRETIVRCLEAELGFYRRILGIRTADG